MSQVIRLVVRNDRLFIPVIEERSERTSICRVFNAILANPDLLPCEPRRAKFGMFRDLSIITLGWGAFAVMITYPVMQLVGLLGCAIALVVRPETPKSDADARVY